MSASVGEVATLTAAASMYETTDALAEAVREQCPQPVGALQIAALLEASGVTDLLAQKRYGYADVFALAEALRRVLMPEAPSVTPPEWLPETWQEKLSDYARGPLTMLPILFLSFIIMAYQQFGGWQNSQVLALGFAMLGSLLVTSGFVQGASRKGASYLSQGYVIAAGRVVVLVMGACVVVALLLAGMVTAVMLLTHWLPVDDLVLLIVAYLALSCLWMVAAVLFLLQQVYWYGLCLGLGVGLSYFILQGGVRLHLSSGLTLGLATGAGLIVLLATTALVTRRTLRQRALASPVGWHPVVLPPAPQLMVSLAAYFIYGILYVTLIIAGHVPGWSGKLLAGTARVTAVSTVEVALTLALGGYILVGGVSEYTIRRFWKRIRFYQWQTPGAQPEAFNQRLTAFFRQEQIAYLRALLFCSALVCGGTLALVSLMERLGINALSWTAETTIIFVLGVIGYGLMAWGIFHCMFMISLSQPGKAITAVVVGIFITLLVGLAAGQWFTYPYGTLGMIAGSFAFALCANYQLRQMWRHADYYYYASF